MKKASILACALLFLSIAGFGQTQSPPPLTQEALAAILGRPGPGSCATQPSGMRQAAKHPTVLTGKSLCTATANCESGTVSCSSDLSCNAVDRNCSVNEPGHVTCDGVTTSCPTACVCSSIGNLIQKLCCRCAQTADCYDCCRCHGGGTTTCANQCG